MADNNENKVLNVPLLRFPEFTDEWKESVLSDFVERVKRKNKNNLCKLPLTISAQYGLVDQISFFNKVIASENMSNYYLLHKGDFAYNKSYSSEYPWGAIKRLDCYEQGTLSSLYICFKPYSHVSSDFLTHYFETSKWHQGISEIAVEGARNHGLLNVGIQDFFETRHCLPQSLLEQEKIAKFLNLIEERIATQNKIIEDLKKLKSAIIEKHYCKVEKQIACVGDLGEPFSVGNLAKDDLTETGIPCVIYGELFTTYGETISQIESHTYKTEGIILSKKGDLLFPSSTTVDAMSLIAPSVINMDGVILGGDMFGIHISPNFNAQYLSYYFNHIAKRQLAKFAKGSTIIHLHYADIEKAKLLLPSLEEQNRMAKCLVTLDDKIKKERTFFDLLNSQKAYLLCHMFI